MKTKRAKCPVCGTHNWSGVEYCQKCSGALYEENNKAEEQFSQYEKYMNLLV
ncbi:MAG: DUF7577 domain-containing protein [Halothermotrichaceae bacterium]